MSSDIVAVKDGRRWYGYDADQWGDDPGTAAIIIWLKCGKDEFTEYANSCGYIVTRYVDASSLADALRSVGVKVCLP